MELYPFCQLHACGRWRSSAGAASGQGCSYGEGGASPSAQRAAELGGPFAGETERSRLSKRAHTDRDIMYFLKQPETHTFQLYHGYTETRPSVRS